MKKTKILGYDGQSCENQINHCLSQPCYNGGTCEQRLNGFTCKCPSKYIFFLRLIRDKILT